LSEEMQKRIVLILSTALAAWTATKLAGMFLEEPEERGSEDDVKEALVQGAFSILATIVASRLIRDVLSKHWGS
jgi:hypothetical protein